MPTLQEYGTNLTTQATEVRCLLVLPTLGPPTYPAVSLASTWQQVRADSRHLQPNEPRASWTQWWAVKSRLSA